MNIIDYPETREMLIRNNGKFIYISYKLNNSQEYKDFLVRKLCGI